MDRPIPTAVTGQAFPLAPDQRGQRLVELRLLDSRPAVPLTAITIGQHSAPGTWAGPRTFVCNDGNEYWIKRRAQAGLLGELVGGRLAELVCVGPDVRLVHVPRSALPAGGLFSAYEGLWVGVRHVPTGISGRNLGLLVGVENLGVRPIDENSRSLVIALQTWLNVEDSQVLVDMATGRVLSIDHGECFKELLKGPPTRIVTTAIPGIPDDYGRRWGSMDRAVSRIEAISEHDILVAVSGVPDGHEWQSPLDRRLAIANWLVKRQPGLREVMYEWSYRLS